MCTSEVRGAELGLSLRIMPRNVLCSPYPGRPIRTRIILHRVLCTSGFQNLFSSRNLSVKCLRRQLLEKKESSYAFKSLANLQAIYCSHFKIFNWPTYFASHMISLADATMGSGIQACVHSLSITVTLTDSKLLLLRVFSFLFSAFLTLKCTVLVVDFN